MLFALIGFLIFLKKIELTRVSWDVSSSSVTEQTRASQVNSDPVVTNSFWQLNRCQF